MKKYLYTLIVILFILSCDNEKHRTIFNISNFIDDWNKAFILEKDQNIIQALSIINKFEENKKIESYISSKYKSNNIIIRFATFLGNTQIIKPIPKPDKTNSDFRLQINEMGSKPIIRVIYIIKDEYDSLKIIYLENSIIQDRIIKNVNVNMDDFCIYRIKINESPIINPLFTKYTYIIENELVTIMSVWWKKGSYHTIGNGMFINPNSLPYQDIMKKKKLSDSEKILLLSCLIQNNTSLQFFYEKNGAIN